MYIEYKVRETREKTGMSLEALAKKVEVSTGWLSDLETGQIKEPGFSKMIRIALALNVDVKVLYKVIY